MKLNGISLNAKDDLIDLNEMMGDEHVMTSLETPMKSDAFILTNEEKKVKIAQHFEQIMETLGLDLTDDSLKGTPARVAKMYVEEVFSGLDPKNKPKVALFENKYLYKEMLVEKDITVKSFCEHHFVPIVGRAHVAYSQTGMSLVFQR
jgi:GTP cyclohydrolase I